MHFLLILIFSTVSFAKFDWQGHRGARGLYPENTINAMKEALKYPITTLEMDVVISKVNKVVVSHEPWMSEEICLDPQGKEVKDKKVNLYSLSFEEIQQYDCGSKIHPRFAHQKKIKETKPLLSTLITEIEKELSSRGLMVNYSIEIKSTPEEEKEGFQPKFEVYSDEVVTLVLSLLPPERFLIQSFDWRVLKYIHKKYPQVSLVALREEPYKSEKILEELTFSPFVFAPDFKLLTKSDITYFHEKKIKVIPWTVNSPEEMKKVMDLGVDGIITDYPNMILNLPDTNKGEMHPDCPKNENRFEGNCVKIPSHAVASPHVPGWVCKQGYVQKRFACKEIKLPHHAMFADDGKTWICNEGFERYRGRCRKK
jgi:glycerophosphoryl diester phosphodiesterase